MLCYVVACNIRMLKVRYLSVITAKSVCRRTHADCVKRSSVRNRIMQVIYTTQAIQSRATPSDGPKHGRIIKNKNLRNRCIYFIMLSYSRSFSSNTTL